MTVKKQPAPSKHSSNLEEERLFWNGVSLLDENLENEADKAGSIPRSGT